jgi:glutamyl/glutaminyl-tRNA synthetase
MSESPCVTRFAPSPTGELHLGNVRTALFNALLAWRSGGRFLLRVEDTDAARSRAEFAAAIKDDLAWLNLHWSGEPLHQSARAAVYNSQLVRLGELGMIYPCFCTPRELELSRATHLAAGKHNVYSG